MGRAQELVEDIHKGLLQWYDFKKGSNLLYVGESNTSLAQMLLDRQLRVTCLLLNVVSDQGWQKEHYRYFDYIICIAELEKQVDPTVYLNIFYTIIKSDGIMLLGMNNRMGIRYFCGDKDIYTGRCFDGVEGYKRTYTKNENEFNGKSYSMAEIKKMLETEKWDNFCFYSVFSDLTNPSVIYSERFLPNEDLSNRLIPFFNHPQTVFMDERMLYGDMIDNGIFHQLANAYLIECTQNGILSDIDHVTCSMDRGRERALFTIIHHSGTVEKRAAYEEGKNRLKLFVKHGQDLAEHGISVVDAKMKNDIYVMPYVKGEVAQLYLKRLIKTDKEKFLQEMDRFRDMILQSSEVVKEDMGDGEGTVLRRGYLDMVPLNSFYIDGEFVFYDQEFCEENYPANAIIARMITTFYCGNSDLNRIIPKNVMFARYNLTDKLEHWLQMERDFLKKLLNCRDLLAYYSRHRINDANVNLNRHKINYSAVQYREIFIDIFKNADTRKLILFGSGKFAKRFLDLYQRDYSVYAVVDNNRDVWGDKINGIEIYPPGILKKLNSDEYKVIVCIRNYIPVMDQLEDLGVTGYSIYDANIAYGGRS